MFKSFKLPSDSSCFDCGGGDTGASTGRRRAGSDGRVATRAVGSLHPVVGAAAAAAAAARRSGTSRSSRLELMFSQSVGQTPFHQRDNLTQTRHTTNHTVTTKLNKTTECLGIEWFMIILHVNI